MQKGNDTMGGTDNSPLVRNVLEVFDERDEDKRLARMKQLYTEGAAFHESHDAIFQGLKAINIHVTELQKSIDRSLLFRPAGTQEQIADLARVAWTLSAEGGPAVGSGMDIGVSENGRIARLYTFIDVPGSDEK